MNFQFVISKTMFVLLKGRQLSQLQLRHQQETLQQV